MATSVYCSRTSTFHPTAAPPNTPTVCNVVVSRTPTVAVVAAATAKASGLRDRPLRHDGRDGGDNCRGGGGGDTRYGGGVDQTWHAR